MKHALKFYSPLIILVLLQVTFFAYLQLLDDPTCTNILGHNTSLLSLLVFCFGLPATVTLGSVYIAYTGYLGLQQGCFPPPDVPGFRNRKVHYGTRAKVMSSVGLLLPAFATFILWLGYVSYTTIADGRSVAQLQEKIMQECQDLTPSGYVGDG